MNLNEKITYFRMMHGLNKSQLAKKLNVSPAYITMIENGKKNPSSELILKIASLFNISPTDIDENFPIDKFKSILVNSNCSDSNVLPEKTFTDDYALSKLKQSLKQLPDINDTIVKGVYNAILASQKKEIIKSKLKAEPNIKIDHELLDKIIKDYVIFALKENYIKIEILPTTPESILIKYSEKKDDELTKDDTENQKE
ncbi:TPA: helix-turn-helix domain-containing protein [Clostridium perfringens]|nr:helix-turn-helix domain-containing protein [Clostridium perfringens]